MVNCLEKSIDFLPVESNYVFDFRKNTRGQVSPKDVGWGGGSCAVPYCNIKKQSKKGSENRVVEFAWEHS